MADLTPIARPYAQAAYEYAKAYDAVANWNAMLQSLSQCVSTAELMQLLDNPAYSQQDIAKIVLDALNEVLDIHCKNFVKIIAEHSRLAAFPSIYGLFLLYKSEDEKAKKAMITTAFKVSDAEIEKLMQKLEQKYQCSIKVETAVDKSLIGGALIEVGDQVIDGSIKGKLHNMQQQLQA